MHKRTERQALVAPFRSEAFAEDLLELFPHRPRPTGGRLGVLRGALQQLKRRRPAPTRR